MPSREQQTEQLQSAFRYALSLTHHRQDAEDLVQQAWLKCRKKYGKSDSFPQLFTVIRNLFYDLRRRDNVIAFEPLEAEEHPEPASVPAPGGKLDMQVLLDRLRPEEREALFLNAVEGYTAQQIADATGKSRNTVLSLIHRARKKLQTQLQKSEGLHHA